MLSKDLELIGLNKKEASLYLAALELGNANINQLAKKSGIKRTTVYDIIESLKQKGLITEANRRNRALFSASSPRKLEEELEEKRNSLKRILPELLSIENSLDSKPKIRFFEGIEGIKEVYKDTLHYPDSELLAWVCEETEYAFDTEFLNGYYLPKRVEKRIWVRAIAPDLEEMKNFKAIDEKLLRKTRLTSNKLYPMDIEINLYGKNKISMMSFVEKFGIIMESQLIFTTLKSIFEMNWKSLESKNKSEELSTSKN